MDTPMRWRELFQQGRGKLTIGILLVEFLVAVEALVVIAIMPAVRHDIGGLEFYGLVFAGFSLAALVLSPIAGRAADGRGPAPPFLVFSVLFIVGPPACGLSLLTWLSPPLVAIGAWLTWSALGHILPAGSLRARPGAPAAVTLIFLLILAFIGADYFIPLMLTAVRGRSLAEASLVITLGTVSWSVGTWWH